MRLLKVLLSREQVSTAGKVGEHGEDVRSPGARIWGWVSWTGWPNWSCAAGTATGVEDVEYWSGARVGRWFWQMRSTSDGRVWSREEGRLRLIGLLTSEEAVEGRILIVIRA